MRALLKRLTPAVILVSLAMPLASHDPITTKLTWTQEISRMVYKRCAGCHHAGGMAMSLTTYEDARPWAKAIRDEVLSRRMPPWGAVKGIGEFAGDPSLSRQEMDNFVAWVEGGAPEGDAGLPPSHGPVLKPETMPMPRYARMLPVVREVTLPRTQSLVAIRPKDLVEGGALEAWAVKPDGAVERLIAVQGFRKRWARDYVLREPLRLPAGTRLRVAAKAGSAVLFFAD